MEYFQTTNHVQEVMKANWCAGRHRVIVSVIVKYQHIRIGIFCSSKVYVTQENSKFAVFFRCVL